MRYTASGIRLRNTVIGWDTAERVRLASIGQVVTRFTLRLTAERIAQLKAAHVPWLLEGVGGVNAVREGELLVVDVLADDRWIDVIG